MKTHRDQTRRNRNIGTAKSGHGQNNNLVIAESYHAGIGFWANLTEYRVVERIIKSKKLKFIVEQTRAESVHACTVDDLVYLLSQLPAQELADFDLIILRQPKRKEEILSSVWGRAVFWVEIDKHEGPAILLEAFNPSKPIRWSRSLTPDDRLELDRLQEDGHQIRSNSRAHIITPTLETIRATQLYRTLLHEIGHHIDFRRCGHDAWEKRSVFDKEKFAHHFADQKREQLLEQGVIPFPRICDPGSLKSEGLHPTDFYLEE